MADTDGGSWLRTSSAFSRSKSNIISRPNFVCEIPIQQPIGSRRRTQALPKPNCQSLWSTASDTLVQQSWCPPCPCSILGSFAVTCAAGYLDCVKRPRQSQSHRSRDGRCFCRLPTSATIPAPGLWIWWPCCPTFVFFPIRISAATAFIIPTALLLTTASPIWQSTAAVPW